jgi:hypothetical protein
MLFASKTYQVLVTMVAWCRYWKLERNLQCQTKLETNEACIKR